MHFFLISQGRQGRLILYTALYREMVPSANADIGNGLLAASCRVRRTLNMYSPSFKPGIVVAGGTLMSNVWLKFWGTKLGIVKSTVGPIGASKPGPIDSRNALACHTLLLSKPTPGPCTFFKDADILQASFLAIIFVGAGVPGVVSSNATTEIFPLIDPGDT